MTTANFLNVYTDGPLNGGTGRFQDLHVQLRGPAAAELGFAFLHSLQAAKADSLADKALKELQQVSSFRLSAVISAVLESDVPKRRRCIQEVLRQAIQTSLYSVHLGTAYFLPPGFLKRALLQQIKKRQIDLQLLLSGDSDVWCDVPATTYLAHKLLLARERSHPLRDWLLLRTRAATLEQQQQQQQQQQEFAGAEEGKSATAAEAATGAGAGAAAAAEGPISVFNPPC
ncbi:cardiolipin synthase, putative [Eimeria acervulina]|uniref:Cardiolipin synthase, putative n=1 Tax=Eimeria acervulina TaxID=5801 RepID=U6GK79_EIMAC|nr:cardiolipin synthase, putative [Eimeria acervulina]CDI80555.1 cardiolipin synthase, putative [Eimeria acervulina]